MEQTQKELSYQTEDHIATKNAAKLFETMTTEDKMELAKYMFNAGIIYGKINKK